jgi:O-antigen/teichoic acid export membrane protein
MSKVQKKIIESSTFGVLNVYVNFLLGMLGTFIIARIISPEEWGFLLLSLTFIGVAVFFSSIFPPGAEGSIAYYIPHLKSENGDSNLEIRNFIFHIYKTRLLSCCIVYIIFLIVISFFLQSDLLLFQITLILSPKIILLVIQNLNISVFIASQKFKLVFLGSTLNVITVSLGYLVIFLMQFTQPLLIITFINLLSSIISVVVSIFFLIPLIPSKKENDHDTHTSYNKNFYKLHKTYGLYLFITGIFANFQNLTVNLLFLNFGVVNYITYFSICDKGVSQTLNFSGSNRSAYTSIFTEINYQKNLEEFKKSFFQLFKYVSFVVCLIAAFFFFFMETYITIVYSETYLIILIGVQIFLFATFSRLINRNLLLIVYSTNHNKISSIFGFLQMVFNISITLIALLFFDFLTLVVFSLISTYLLSIILMVLINKIIDFKLKIKQLFYPFLLFTICITITFLASFFINFQFFNNSFFDTIFNSAIYYAIFIVSVYVLVYLTKYITREELNQLLNLVPILKSKRKFIQRINNFIIKLFPSRDV